MQVQGIFPLEILELAGHFKVIKPLGIHFLEFDRTKLDLTLRKETVLTEEAANVREVFYRQQCSFLVCSVPVCSL